MNCKKLVQRQEEDSGDGKVVEGFTMFSLVNYTLERKSAYSSLSDYCI